MGPSLELHRGSGLYTRTESETPLHLDGMNGNKLTFQIAANETRAPGKKQPQFLLDSGREEERKGLKGSKRILVRVSRSKDGDTIIMLVLLPPINRRLQPAPSVIKPIEAFGRSSIDRHKL